MTIVKKITHILSIFVYIFITIYALICVPSIFGYKPLVVLTGSMAPTYKEGSIIYYHKVDKSELKKGDAITFKIGNNDLVSHRINDIVDGLYVTKGDANNTVDSIKVNYEYILGKDLDFSIPYLGYYVRTINDNTIFPILAIAILLFEFIINNIRTKDNKNKDNQNSNNKEEVTIKVNEEEKEINN